MAGTIELPKNVRRGKARKNMHWPEGLRRLPAEFGLLTTDLGFEESEQRRIGEKAAAGKDKKAVEIFNKTREVLLELMARDTAPRHVESNSGKKVYFDHNGEPTTNKYSTHITNDGGEFIQHEPVIEDRSRWGVRAGRETLTAPGAEMPRPGHLKLMVEENFEDLFPRLVFRSKTPDTKYVHKDDNRDAFLAAHKQATSDDGELRSVLLDWLPEFMKQPQSKWNGED